MTINVQIIEQIKQEPWYIQLPKDWAMDKTQANDTWDVLLQEVITAGIKSTLWQHCHLLAELLETYPINNVKVLFERDDDHGEDVFAHLVIDGMKYDSEEFDITHPIESLVHEIDGGHLFNQVVHLIEQTDLDCAIKRIGELNVRSKSFTSSAEARAGAREIFPEMEAMVVRWMLRNNLSEVSNNTLGPATSPTPKM